MHPTRFGSTTHRPHRAPPRPAVGHLFQVCRILLVGSLGFTEKCYLVLKHAEARLLRTLFCVTLGLMRLNFLYSELLTIVGLANETNRLVTALEVAVDPQFL